MAALAFAGSRKIAMTISDFLSPRIAGPFDQGRRSICRAFLERVMEGRIRKAEDEIARYLVRSDRQLPAETARQGALIESS